jgi:hypothetical protein
MRASKLLSAVVLVSAAAAAQSGPDVIVGAISGPGNFGSSGGIYAYSLGTDSCNIGTVWLNWFAGTNQHPVIGQNIYRLKNGRFEQIGMSWLKHGFFALSLNLCFNDCQATDGTHLGVHCSDPYDSGLNGSQGNGPRNEVNAATGYFPYPIAGSYPPAAPTIGRRIQCAAADVNPALNAGALYFGEGQYVSPDDAAAGNQNNNASYRPMQFAAGSFNGSFTGPTVQQQPAIMAWQANDASVVNTFVDVPFDGRFIIAKKVTDLGGGNHHFEFAIHNLNSDRSGRGFTVTFPAGTTITNAGFKDISYHSGEPYSGTDWGITINGPTINWSTETFAQNPNANALRWGTLYNFWFNATASAEITKQIQLFKPGPCPPDPNLAPMTYVLNTAAPYDNPTLTAPVAGPSGNDVAAPLPIGFSFDFYGVTYSSVYASTNGFLTFSPFGATAAANTCLPAPAYPNGVVAGLWDDLVVDPGECQYQTIGTAPNRKFVVAWTNVSTVVGGASQSFKVILHETTNAMTSTIVASADGGAGATRGIEDLAGGLATQGSCNQAGSAVPGTSWTYTPQAVIGPTAALAITGFTGPGGSLTWDVNSNGPNVPLIIVASFDPGPTDMGPYGILNIGFSPGAWVVVADGGGVLQPANPSDFTDDCGDFSVTYPVGPGLPTGLTILNQGAVIAPFSVPPPPNGAFHILTLAVINT